MSSKVRNPQSSGSRDAAQQSAASGNTFSQNPGRNISQSTSQPQKKTSGSK